MIDRNSDLMQDVAAFARLSVQARTLRTLATGDFPGIITSGEPVFIDFFAPWCPPCMNLLPEFRKVS
jgi:DnaJ family protein C protein 10